MPRSDNGLLMLSVAAGRDMRHAKTDGKKPFIDAAVGVVWSPAGGVLKQAYRANASIATEIEPVERASRNPNQISCFHFDRQYRAVLRVNMKQTMTGDDESHFVFVVPVFAIEFREHLVKSGCCGTDVDHISSDVTAANL